jgi:hypothetical protein
MSDQKYVCKMCGSEKNGNPAFKNNAGDFCEDCKTEIHKRSTDAKSKISGQWDGCCKFCGHKITKAKPSPFMLFDAGAKHIHNDCANKRDWMLNCIRYSDYLSRYVFRTETKEREARELAKKEQKQMQMQASKPQEKIEQSRIDRLELMIEKLAAALGGI